MILLIPVLGWASSPTMCDPRKDTAPITAGGYCIEEPVYEELGKLRVEVRALENKIASREAELLLFEEWRVQRASEFQQTLAQMQGQYAADLEAARKRSFAERHGFVGGLLIGVVATTATTAVLMDVYGNILSQP